MKHFGQRLLQTLLGFSAIGLILGCSREPDTATVSGDIKTRIPVTSENGTYSLQEVQLSGVTSLYELGGKYATFYIYPTVSESKIRGHHPKTRFAKSGELYIAQDELTLQMAVIYAHFQRLADLDKEVGAEGINTWPRDVGIAVRYKNDGNIETNNAFYDGVTDAMLIVPYTQENLPIAVNAGILAHEHFHSLYYKLVEKEAFKRPMPLHSQHIADQVLEQGREISKVQPRDGEDFQKEYHELLSRGLNEGLADFWAWIYTGDPDFLQASLPKEKVARSLDMTESQVATHVFPNIERWKTSISNRFDAPKTKDDEPCWGVRVSYCLGSNYARTLKRFTAVVQSSRSLQSREARKLVGAAIVKALPEMRQSLMGLKKDDYIEPSSFFSMVQKNLAGLQTDEKNFLETVVQKSKGRKTAEIVALPSQEKIPTKNKSGPPPLIPPQKEGSSR